MKKRKLLFVLLILVLGFFFFQDKDEGNRLKDNYYQVINREVLLDNPLEEGEYSWSYFLDAQERVNDHTNEIVQDILSGKVEGLEDNEIKVIHKIYDKALDIESRNRDGIEELEPYLDKVWNVTTVHELVDVIVTIEKELGVDILTSVEVMADYKDNTKNIVYFVPVTFAFGSSSDYIVNEDYMAYKAYLRRACIQLWKTYGRDTKEAREVVERVFKFYEEVASHSKDSSELEDISSYYQIVTEDDINDIFTNVNNDYLVTKGLDDREVYSLVDKEQYQYLNDSLTMDNLEVWKEVIVTKILASYASYGSSDYVKIINDLNEALLGSEEDKTEEEQAVDLVKNLFASEIDGVYEKKNLTQEQKIEIEEMVLEIKKVYEKRLRNNDWLSDEAIEKALVKLEVMDVIVGIDEEVIDYWMANNLEVSDDSLIKDVIKMQQIAWEEELERLDSGEKINLVSQSVVNAYYQPLDNSIVIPVAFFELVGDRESYYEKLGTLGMILAHEVTHGFDGNGSQFDEKGNLNNWWSEEDKKTFQVLKEEVSQYYSGYEVLNGKYIDGDKTVNENIADLGAIACISEIAIDRGASEEEMKEMYSSFAEIWASHESEEYMELLLLQDVHAPNQFRVNAVLSSNDYFYKLYDIYPWDEMWVSKDKRVSVW